MTSPALPVIAAALLVLASQPVAAEHVESGITWACGFGGSGRSGHPSDCGINPVGGQGVQSDGYPQWGDAWIEGDERVLGVVVNGDAHAVPVKMLDRHEILNDDIGGVPVAVTYCPLCGSGITFEREVTMDGQARVLDFSASGFLWKHDLVMWDPQTDTLWNQILGQPIGTLRDERVVAAHPDARLRVIATQITTWDGWRAEHPGSPMLQALPGIRYGGAYAGYDDSCSIGISGAPDCDIEGLHPKEEVIGVEGPRGPAAFPYFGVLSSGGIAFDEPSGVVVSATSGGSTQAFDAGRHVFRHEEGRWLDEKGRAWDLPNGTRGDKGLAPLEFLPLYWFAWRDHHPDTRLWLPEDVEGGKALRDDGELPGFAIPVVAAILIVLAWSWSQRWNQ